MANSARVCGVVAVVLSLIPCTLWLGLGVSVVAVVLGIVALRSDKTVAAGATGSAKLGIQLGCVGILIAIVWVVALVAINQIGNETNEKLRRAGESLSL